MPEQEAHRIRTNPPPRHFRKQLKAAALTPEAIFRAYLRLKFGTPHPQTHQPNPDLPNHVLQTREEWQAALAEGKRLHFPLHRDHQKNWDHLAAISAIRDTCDPTANILDAGAEFYSNVLPALFLLGFRNLFGVNLSFPTPTRRGPIHYLPGDITQLPFPDSFFHAITSMSVIEHGVPLDAYFREMHRVLKPGGLLITSTDYFPTPIDTHGHTEHGAPIKVFTQPEIETMLELAKHIGFEQTGPLNLDCKSRPIRWAKFNLEYTFVLFTLRKPTPNPS